MPRTRKTYEERLEANGNQIQKHLEKIQELLREQRAFYEIPEQTDS